MMRVYELTAKVAFGAAVLFGLLEVVYGYQFHVWHESYDGLLRGYDAMHYPTKLGETVLFGFLALFFPLLSLAASSLARSASNG